MNFNGSLVILIYWCDVTQYHFDSSSTLCNLVRILLLGIYVKMIIKGLTVAEDVNVYEWLEIRAEQTDHVGQLLAPVYEWAWMWFLACESTLRGHEAKESATWEPVHLPFALNIVWRLTGETQGPHRDWSRRGVKEGQRGCVIEC